MPPIINDQGDQFRPTDGGYGIDIASQRQDDLDRECLASIHSRMEAGHGTKVVELGGGFGTHAIRMAEAGAAVLMIDIADMASDKFAKACGEMGIAAERLMFLQKNFATLSRDDIPANFDVLYSQRAIHYVPYRTAQALMRMLSGRMAGGGRVFLSAAGYDTEYGKSHPDRMKPIEERFNFVEPEMRKRHGIEQKVATYKQEELARLLESAGFEVTRIWASSFGNIKAIARKAG